MKASLRSVRIAPKKANLVAGMVRGMSVPEALTSLQHTNKKAARILQGLLESAVANAKQEKQNPDELVIKTLIVNKAQAFHRGVPMARGRVRPMRKFLSHISLTLGVAGAIEAPKAKEEKKPAEAKATKAPAKKATTTTKKAAKTTSKAAAKPAKSTSKSTKSKTSASKKDTTSSTSSSGKSTTKKSSSTKK